MGLTNPSGHVKDASNDSLELRNTATSMVMDQV